MKPKILFIQGAMEGAYKEDALMVDEIKKTLGAEFSFIYPEMPHEEKPDYMAWSRFIDDVIQKEKGIPYLIGHSIGGSVLIKYLSEENPGNIKSAFILSAPFWGKSKDWEWKEVELKDNACERLQKIPHLLFYQASDDEITPAQHVQYYKEKIPQSHIEIFDTGGHQLKNQLKHVAKDIREIAGK